MKASWRRLITPAGMAEPIGYQKPSYHVRGVRFLQAARDYRAGIGLLIALSVSLILWALIYVAADRVFL